MLRLWKAFQGGGMGIGHLPDAGGFGDQAAIMIEAFEIMSAAKAELQKPKKDR